MIIYITNEISVRELPGYLLFATVAAAEKKQVFILSSTDTYLYSRLSVLKPGALLVKNLNIPTTSAQMYQQYIDQSLHIYCQEQEPPIIFSSIDKYTYTMQITVDQILPFKAVFCFGDRDTTYYKELFSNRGKIFHNTGSPRVNIWTDKFTSLYLSNNTPQSNRGYILVVSNFGSFMGRNHMTEMLVTSQSLELLNTLDLEEEQIQFYEEDVIIGLRTILALKHLAHTYPHIRILVRPHPVDNVKYWLNIFGKLQPNVEVISNQDDITPWIAGAVCIIQNGCTSALEAVVQKIPVISYGPDRIHGGNSIPNQMGIRCRTFDELKSAVNRIIKTDDYTTYQEQSETLLKPILNYNCNAAAEMLKIMAHESQLLTGYRLTGVDVLKLRAIRQSKSVIDSLRKLNVERESYTLNAQYIRGKIAVIARILKLPVPRIHMIGDSGVLIEN
ncbi:surface carbohydrate biosynthesis protein [Cylindrospermopsis raciborskii UAM/DH-MRr]|uniref:surface carbohydrate biosynthesis protein n=1 Tax=Cylindrospermopsis raciborskii TaxID=77022 RepID=UPI00387989B4